jgi:parallel beta-helix repeat protein
LLANNTIDGNSLGVIITRSSYDNSIQHNMIKGSHSNGIYLYENSTNNNTFKNNTIRESIVKDIYVQDKSTSNNTFITNNITEG